LRDVYLGPGGVLTGSARVAREAEERLELLRQRQTEKDRQLAVKIALRSLDAKIAELEAEKQAREDQLTAAVGENEEQKAALLADRDSLRRSRGMIDSSGRSQRPNGRESKP
jgi:circadian clock protein KaiC